MLKLSVSNDRTFNFKPYELSIEQLKEGIRKEYSFCSAVFKDGHRLGENVLGFGNCFILDFDIVPDNYHLILMEQLKKWTFLIHTTKSHQKIKNGFISDRFRLYIPSVDIECDKEHFEAVMKKLVSVFGSDASGVSAAHPFKGFKDAQIFTNEGELWDYRKLKIDIEQKKYFIKSSSKKDFMNKEKWPVMFNPENIGQGMRNNELARYLLWARDSGCDKYEAEQVLFWINEHMQNPLKQNEVFAILKGKYK